MCGSPRKPYQCGTNTVSKIFQRASSAADQGYSAHLLISVNLADAEATLNMAMEQLKTAKAVSTDIEAAKRENPELESSITTMFQIADDIINKANSAFLTKKIMKGARNARNRRTTNATARGALGGRRKKRTKKNRRN